MKEYISNNYASYEGDGVELLRTDRNGTRYYIDHKCPKCGGTGNIWYYGHVEGGVCFLCEGTGIKPRPFKVMTPEYAAILADRRNRKLRAQSFLEGEELRMFNHMTEVSRQVFISGIHEGKIRFVFT